MHKTQAIVTVELFSIHDADRMRAALAIRTRVFVDEQAVPPDEEIDTHDRIDAAAVHALVFDDGGVAIGAGRYYPIDASVVQIGRMAIDRQARGRGAGTLLLAALLREGRERGFARAHLHAQLHARTFYLRAGFSDDGATFMDAGIRHQPMSASLADPPFS